MKKYVLKSITFSLILVLTVSLNACKKDKAGVAPVLPPSSSMSTDFSDFNSQGQKGVANWFHAAANITVWNTILAVGLAVPVASFNEAFNHEAVLQETNRWMWTYSFGGNKEYTAKLYGTVNNDVVDWEMHISKSGNYTDFLWYTGTSAIDGSSGSWNLNEKPSNPKPFIAIIWSKEDDGTFNIKYTNTVSGDKEKGAYISYGTVANADLDVFYHIYNKEKDNLIEVEYSTSNKNGRVKDFLKFKDYGWNCWNADLQDISCE